MPQRLIKALATISILAMAFTLALARVNDFDVWWHLECGKLLLTQGVIPRQEFFSYTASGRPWVDGYLLAQAVFYIVWKIAGVASISVLGAALIAGAYGIALSMSRPGRAGFMLALFTAPPAIYLAVSVMISRPALFSPIFGLITLRLLERHRLKAGNGIYLLIPVAALWTNCHPGFLLGPIFTAIYAMANIGNRPKFKTYAIVFAGQIIATFINPYGPFIYYSAFSIIGGPELRNAILEWKPLYGEPRMMVGAIPCFIAVIVMGAMSFIYAWRKIRLEHLIIFVLMALATLFGRRNLLLFGTVSIPLIAWTVSEGTGERAKLPAAAQWAVSCLIVVMSLFMIWFAGTDWLYYYAGLFRSSGIGINASMFPVGAVDFLERENIQGRVFHDYSQGGYLMFRLYPKYQVFIDGRIYPYPYSVFISGEKALLSVIEFETIRAQYDIRAVVMPTFRDQARPLIEGLAASPDWAVVEADGSGILFLRRGAGNDAIISKYEINLFASPITLPAHNQDGKPEYPFAIMWWAAFYENMGRPDFAARTLELATAYRPAPKGIDSRMGSLLVRAGRLDDGLKLLNRALGKDAGDVTALMGMADYFVAMKSYDKADEILGRFMLLTNPPEGFRATMGDLEYARGNLDLAGQYYIKALPSRVHDGRLWERLALCVEARDMAKAMEFHTRALTLLKITGAPAEDIQRIEDRMRRIAD